MARAPLHIVLLLMSVRVAWSTSSHTTCLGSVDVNSFGEAQVTNAGYNVPGKDVGLTVVKNKTVIAHMSSRSYFANSCSEGSYYNERYMGLKLLGRTFRFTTEISEAGCGCNAALYLVSMKQNSDVSKCDDYYCDANKVCGVSCAEVDIMEANKRAWHSTLHSPHDNSGVGGGNGGGSDWNGPRDWTIQEYGPGGSCIDTMKPIQVAASFPVDDSGKLKTMEVRLWQHGTDCHLDLKLDTYSGMGEIHDALHKGMTPVISYWKAHDMLWMDGKGADGQGPCSWDADHCGEAARFYNFSMEALPGQPPLPPVPVPASASGLGLGMGSASIGAGLFGAGENPLAQLPATTSAASATLVPEVPALPFPVTPAPTLRPAIVPMSEQGTCAAAGQDCRSSQCCSDGGRQCYLKNQWWAECKKACAPGIDPTDEPQYQQPWECTPLGPRNNAGAPFAGLAPFLGSASTSRRLAALALASILVLTLGIVWLRRSFTAPKNGMAGSSNNGQDMRRQTSPYNNVWHTNQQFMQTSPSLAPSPASSVLRHPFVGAAVLRGQWQPVQQTLNP